MKRRHDRLFADAMARYGQEPDTFLFAFFLCRLLRLLFMSHQKEQEESV
jgi:hypothetical protein